MFFIILLFYYYFIAFFLVSLLSGFCSAQRASGTDCIFSRENSRQNSDAALPHRLSFWIGKKR